MHPPDLSLNSRLAACSWSLQPATPAQLVDQLLATGIRRVQLALDPLRDDPVVWGATEDLFRQNGISLVSGMFGCVGEDYSTLESIRITGGIGPDATWAENLGNIQTTVGLASRLGLELVTFHAGFLPHDETDPEFLKLLNRLGVVADLFAEKNISLGLETGQETAPALSDLLRKLNRPNVGVNFDPANMLLYNKGNPIAALRLLAPWLRQVHIKDANQTQVPGTWGEEVAAGSGQVDWAEFFATLRHLNYTGNLVIEREAGTQRVADIRTARAVVEKYFTPA